MLILSCLCNWFPMLHVSSLLSGARSMANTTPTSGTIVSNGITADAVGNTYVTRYLGGTADFDPGPGTANFSSAGGIDIFFAKYDDSGNYVYARSAFAPFLLAKFQRLYCFWGKSEIGSGQL